MLGYKQLAWKSVIIPSIMPKPDVLALTGGYRKTPFLQIGSDIYCDTALICDVLEHCQPEPDAVPGSSTRALARVLAQWADTTLFWAAMAYNLQPKGAAALFDGAPPEAAKAFGADRAAMSAGMTRLRPGDASAAYKSYLRRIANMLDGQDFLLGNAPCVADFAAYHPLWFTRKRGAGDGRHSGRHPCRAGLDGPHGGARTRPHGKILCCRSNSGMRSIDGGYSPKRLHVSGRTRHSSGQPGHGGGRELWHRCHRRRTDRRHPHPLQPAPGRSRAPARCRCTFRASATCSRPVQPRMSARNGAPLHWQWQPLPT